MSTPTPQADHVGHPAMDPGSYQDKNEGLYSRPGLEGQWSKRMEFWRENGQQCGAWCWVRSEESSRQVEQRSAP